MSTLSLEDSLPLATVDDFGALEERVLRAVEVVKTERAARAKAEETSARLQDQIDEQTQTLEHAQEQIRTLEREREQVRQRVEKLLKQLDEITA
jgi:septal ring factor EnvC (AmiA/AmiB activator)